MLEKFRKAKQDEILALQRQQEHGHEFVPWTGARPDFAKTLIRPESSGIIAEYKRASPSKGDINVRQNALEVCSAYRRAGACALSILTEKEYFKGRISYLHDVSSLGLPLLRKDFIIHPVQIMATRATPASAILLIVRMFANQSELGDFHRLCLDYGLEPIVEVFDKHDLDRAKEIGARIIQVNNRDLDTLQTDLNRSLSLVQHKENSEIWIGASGISTLSQIQTLKNAGLDALLIGTALMSAQNQDLALTALTGLPRRNV